MLSFARGSGATVTAIVALHRMEQAYTIKRVDGGNNNTNIGTTSGQTIDGAATKTLVAQYSAVTLMSDGANWQIVNLVGTVS